MEDLSVYKVYGIQLFAMFVTLSDVHLFFTIVLVFATIVYTVYKIMELEAKRRFYKRQREIDENLNKKDEEDTSSG